MSGSIADRWNRGDAIEQFTPAERDWLRREMRSDPAYRDAKARTHAALVADVSALYEADNPNRPEPNTVFVEGRLVDLNAPGGVR